MHNNYYFLKQLTAALKPKLVNSKIVSCFSQEKDELILGFTNGEADFYIKAILTPQFSALTFPTNFNRARQNSANLFPDIIGQKVIDVVQIQNERAFYLKLENNLSLLFKMFGNRSNIILFADDVPIILFQKKFVLDLNLRLSAMDRELLVNKEQFISSSLPVTKVFPTFGDLPVYFLANQGYDEASPETQWQLLEETRLQLENPLYFIINLNGRTRLSLLPVGEVRTTFNNPVEALQEFVRLYLTEGSFEKKYQQVKQMLQKKLSGSKQYLEQLEYKILELEYDETFSQTADLIMANLTNIPVNASKVEVYDFYNDKQTIIKLPTTESPQKYAEKLYRKSKNRQIELKYLIQRVESKKTELIQLQALNQRLFDIKTNKDLKLFLKENEFLVVTPKEDIQSPFREFEAESYKILVGKSAKNNDLLTQRFTFKEDLWLHAKDVAGSHVVIKYQPGKNIPETVLEKAAQLAAWYSKRKNDSLCPVLYTPKKYVRKPKGAAPGEVFVEREKVILVKPENPFKEEIS